MSIFKQKEMGLIKRIIGKEKKLVQELARLSENSKNFDKMENSLVSSQIKTLKKHLIESSKNLRKKLEKIEVKTFSNNSLEIRDKKIQKDSPLNRMVKKKPILKPKKYNFDLSAEIESLEKLHKVKKESKKIKKRKPNFYIAFSNKFFAGISLKLLKKGNFRTLSKDLSRAKLRILPKSYVSIILFTTLLSFLFSVVITLFLLFFNISLISPFLTPVQGNLLIRFAKIFWILFVIPIGTYFFVYFYPLMERKSLGAIIDQELPFATINMSAISGSQIEPSKIFEIIIRTNEYPNIQKEFTALLN